MCDYKINRTLTLDIFKRRLNDLIGLIEHNIPAEIIAIKNTTNHLTNRNNITTKSYWIYTIVKMLLEIVHDSTHNLGMKFIDNLMFWVNVLAGTAYSNTRELQINRNEIIQFIQTHKPDVQKFLAWLDQTHEDRLIKTTATMLVNMNDNHLLPTFITALYHIKPNKNRLQTLEQNIKKVNNYISQKNYKIRVTPSKERNNRGQMVIDIEIVKPENNKNKKNKKTKKTKKNKLYSKVVNAVIQAQILSNKK